jgi:alkylhydroperoxidase family enzyme
MPRIPYKPLDNAGPEEVAAPIRARRGGTLLHIDCMLLHSLPFAAGWGGFLRAVRTELALPFKLRELAMCAVSALLGTAYELHHHRPEFLKAGGSADSPLFDAAERAVLRLAVEMTREGRASDATFAAVSKALPDDTQVVELVGVIAAYNMVGRFLNALDVQPETSP